MHKLEPVSGQTNNLADDEEDMHATPVNWS